MQDIQWLTLDGETVGARVGGVFDVSPYVAWQEGYSEFDNRGSSPLFEHPSGVFATAEEIDTGVFKPDWSDSELLRLDFYREHAVGERSARTSILSSVASSVASDALHLRPIAWYVEKGSMFVAEQYLLAECRGVLGSPGAAALLKEVPGVTESGLQQVAVGGRFALTALVTLSQWDRMVAASGGATVTFDRPLALNWSDRSRSFSCSLTLVSGQSAAPVYTGAVDRSDEVEAWQAGVKSFVEKGSSN